MFTVQTPRKVRGVFGAVALCRFLLLKAKTMSKTLTTQEEQVVENLARINSILSEARRLTDQLEPVSGNAASNAEDTAIIGYLKEDIHRVKGRLMQFCPSRLQHLWQNKWYEIGFTEIPYTI